MSCGECSTLIAFGPVMLSLGAEVLYNEFVLDEGGSAIHAGWAYPLMSITALAAPLFPIGALVSLVVAALFKLIACYAEDDAQKWDKQARVILGIAVFDLLSIAHVVIRIFNPNASYNWMPEIAMAWSKEDTSVARASMRSTRRGTV